MTSSSSAAALRSALTVITTCSISACANALLLRDSHPLNIHTAAVVARRTTRLPTTTSTNTALQLALQKQLCDRHRTTRTRRPCASTFTPYHRPNIDTTTTTITTIHSFITATTTTAIHHQQAIYLGTAHSHFRREENSLVMAHIVSPHNSFGQVAMQSAPLPRRTSSLRSRARRGKSTDDTELRHVPDEAIATALAHSDDVIENRSSRSASTASRTTHRLSLTLPIAPPNPNPSRPIPTSTTTASFPPTPFDTPAITSPADSNDFITAIAAQERRVLELREELSRAESDLAKLKKQWATHEAYKKRGERPLRPVGPVPTFQDDEATKRAVELDRRKVLLQSLQNQNQPLPENGRRRVFQGGHARTLSLLSPTKPSSDFRDGSENSRNVAFSPSHRPKHQSWAPQTASQTVGVKGIAQDLRQGLWTFMEDLRQATVGDEPITGQGMYIRGADGKLSMTPMPNGGAASSSSRTGTQDAYKPSGLNTPRNRSSTAFDWAPAAPTSRSTSPQKEAQDSAADTALKSPSRPAPALMRSKTDASKSSKRFSWTPLTMESVDDNDWSNWETAGTATSTRWSGTTVNGDIIPSTTSEKRTENDTSL
ncbi:hypothetical protein SMACR_07532 [Sordaria macrospora]|uniref:WGS project CABT00000000 data, contig 2.7 n=2 Tax=Sordaria macrospora TaxID=5147 RepID=F7VTQ8_SORMK|nr:uncharacterized protein SMAC_07532 [Sordaria macrospora k-hell]KAA8634475.1 hypothetical protein SMACR_07532 [Sordaria macrospora]KAH7632657.1 hypothetical protein B0T09DRAFT_331683 [Sordaria sp. MPI-SDFR-AT-0083]WPJ60860.1 hypothetical protein SMAC4_07532 [Sordaria macrospora]CCC08896.1 unnamed protein product [Sordaria macrospora k-hell]